MAPIRRYLRITKWSVLEVRIYLDDPALAHSWLLNSRDPVLPRVIQAVRPLVIPKLREENERTKNKGKGKKAKGIKDSVSEDDFDVSIFLTDLSTPHSLLTKQKDFRSKEQRIRSNSGKLTGWLTETHEDSVTLEEAEAPIVIREESDDEQGMRLEDYPEANAPVAGRKRARDDSNESLFVDENVSDDEGFQTLHSEPLSTKRTKNIPDDGTRVDDDEGDDDKKKLSLSMSYDGFSIYGKILCLVVKRKGGKGKSTDAYSDQQTGRQMLESWIGTQAAQEPGIVDDRNVTQNFFEIMFRPSDYDEDARGCFSYVPYWPAKRGKRSSLRYQLRSFGDKVVNPASP